MPLLYDVAVIQWIMSCHKNHMTTRVKRLWCEYIISLTTSMYGKESVFYLFEIMFILKDHMINRILHEWSCHIKFMKLARGLFHKFHMK